MSKLRKLAPTFNNKAVMQQYGDAQDITSQDFNGKWLAIIFYEKNKITPASELIGQEDLLPHLKEMNCDLVGVSTDTIDSHLAWLAEPREDGGINGLKFPLIADSDLKMCADQGVLAEEDDEGYEGVALRSTFIIDPSGKLRKVEILDRGMQPIKEEIVRAIKAFQFTEKNGKVCPMNWTSEIDMAIPLDEEKKKEFFKEKFKA